MSRPLRLYDAPSISESPIAVTGPAEKPEHLVALGANLPSEFGDPRATLEAALVRLAARGLAVTARSRWFRTSAYPPGSGPDYVNGAVRLAASQPPEAVLAALHAVEDELGRRRGRRWGPRVCDLDLLASGGAVRPDRATVAAWIARTGDARVEAPQRAPPAASPPPGARLRARAPRRGGAGLATPGPRPHRRRAPRRPSRIRTRRRPPAGRVKRRPSRRSTP